MKTIWKFPLRPGTTALNLPAGAEILHVGEQEGGVNIWALLDPSHPDEERVFQIWGTGWQITVEPGQHVGTVQMRDGLVWHVFEVSDENPA